MTFPDKFKKRRFAIYLRRSMGESGSTKQQLSRIEKSIDALEKHTGRKINRTIVGKDINSRKKFNPKKDLQTIGDIYNEGEGASGFKTEGRPVLMELIKRMKDGTYDGIAVESFDRFSRDILGMAHFALPLWREDGKMIYSFTEGKSLDSDLEAEALLGITSLASSLTKFGEIKKARTALKGKIAEGYLAGSTPEWLGAKTSGGRGIDYRRFWKLAEAAGENERGNLNNPTDIGRIFKKDNKWSNLWYQKLKQYKKAKVLDTWLDNVDAINNYIRVNGKEYPRRFFNQKPVKNLLARTRGYFGYPAGVNLAGTTTFVIFPVPMDVGINDLAEAKNVPIDYVESKELDDKELMELMPIQTQPRARGK